MQTRQSERKLQAELARTALNDGGEIQQDAESVEALQAVQEELKRLRSERKASSRKVTIDSLPEAERPTQLPPLNKLLCDAVKMIAYRAETAMVALVRRHLKNEDDARALIRELLVASADIQPDAAAHTLTVKIQRMASPVHDRAIAALLDALTQQEFQHPETGAKMAFALVQSAIPASAEVRKSETTHRCQTATKTPWVLLCCSSSLKLWSLCVSYTQ